MEIGGRDYGDLGTALGSLLGNVGAGISQGHALKQLLGEEDLSTPQAAARIALLPENLQEPLLRSAQQKKDSEFLKSLVGGSDEPIASSSRAPQSFQRLRPEGKEVAAEERIGPRGGRELSIEELQQLRTRAPGPQSQQYLDTLIKQKVGEKPLAKNQPAPPEVQQSITEFLSNTPTEGLSEEEIYSAGLGAGVPKEYMSDLLDLRIKRDDRLSKGEKERWMASSPYVREVDSAATSLMRQEKVLNQMQENAKSGELMSPIGVAALDYLGVPLGVIANPVTQQQKSLTKELFDGIRNVFGGRILQAELQLWQEMIPSLTNSAEGQILLADTMKWLGKGKIAEKELKDQVIKENGGVPPYDLQSQVISRLGPELDKLAQEFKKAYQTVPMTNEKGQIADVPGLSLEEAKAAGWRAL